MAYSMRRTSTMTLGFVLIFLGIQFALVDSYQLTPRVANFLSEQRRAPQVAPQVVQNPNQRPYSPYTQAGYQVPQQAPPLVASIAPVQRTITPPRWLCWPMLFCGTVVLLHGLSKPRH